MSSISQPASDSEKRARVTLPSVSRTITNQPSTFLPFALPDIGQDELDEVRSALMSGWITTGEKTKNLETQFSLAVQAKHGIAVNSCTAALHLALDSIGLAASDEVVTTTYTFAATAEVVRYFGAVPVLVDVDPVTFNIDAKLLERAISPRTKAIIPVHIAGLPADLSTIVDIAKRFKLRVIEDAAHAFPSAYHGTMIGTIADITCFSFYATKTLTTGKGG